MTKLLLKILRTVFGAPKVQSIYLGHDVVDLLDKFAHSKQLVGGRGEGALYQSEAGIAEIRYSI